MGFSQKLGWEMGIGYPIQDILGSSVSLFMKDSPCKRLPRPPGATFWIQACAKGQKRSISPRYVFAISSYKPAIKLSRPGRMSLVSETI